jgi:hypothetical protein
MDIQDPKRPFWDKWGVVPTLAVLVPLTFGIVKFIEEWYHRGTEIELAVLSEKHDIRLKYLAIALQPNKSDEQSERVLRFLVGVKDDTLLSGWAEKELKTITKRISIADSMQRKIDTLNQRFLNIQFEGSAFKTKSRKQIEELNTELLAVKKERDDLVQKRSNLYTNENAVFSVYNPSGINYGSFTSTPILNLSKDYGLLPKSQVDTGSKWVP